MSIETKEIFKQQLQFKKQQSKRKLTVKKLPKWIIPTAYYRQYRKIILTILNKYIGITESLFPLLENWSKEVKSIKEDAINKFNNDLIQDEYIKIELYNIRDQWEEELENINVNEYEKVFENEKESLKRTLLSMGVLISVFNRKQWEKMTKQQFGFEPFIYEKWENSILNFWVNRNVNLIKGLTDEYRKKIIDTIFSENAKGLSVAELQSKLKKINSTFSDYRTNLIAKDQINKINNQLAEQRQKDAGVETYIWRTAKDERVVGNPSGKYPTGNEVHHNHWIMEGLLCRWDDPTVYSDDNGAIWKKRTSEMPQVHPGEEINDRCIAEPNFEPIINKVNNE